ncbi:MAG: hypothetical protein GXZ10_13445 [Gammaproteobacteria bacterium]|nr:hypothetical protein [Gammaproteobacteria bacterium]
MSLYDDMETMVGEMLAPESEGGLGQGAVQLIRVTPGVPDSAKPWLPVQPTEQTELLKGAVKGVSSKLVGTEVGSAVILASDREAICAAPNMRYQAGDILSVDGVRVNILSVQRIPEAGTTVAVKFIVRS